MAKAKKDTTQTDATPAGDAKAKKAPAKKAEATAKPVAAATAKPAAGGAKKPAATAKGSKPSSGPISHPLIDTNLAASAAAAMVANRNTLGAGATAGGQAKESSSFRQLKESLAKPGAQNLGGILGTGPAQQKKTQAHGPDKQIGRNQTFGADVNRSSVPRRTGGG